MSAPVLSLDALMHSAAVFAGNETAIVSLTFSFRRARGNAWRARIMGSERFDFRGETAFDALSRLVDALHREALARVIDPEGGDE